MKKLLLLIILLLSVPLAIANPPIADEGGIFIDDTVPKDNFNIIVILIAIIFLASRSERNG